MSLPLALRALGRAPLRRLTAAITRSPTFWVPSDGRVVRDWAPLRLSTATTARAVRKVMTTGRPYASTGPQFRRLQVLTLALNAGHLSPALLDWCLASSGGVVPLVRHLRANPAVTPRDLQVVRVLLEERAWREAAAADLRQTWGRATRDPVASNLSLEYTVSAWLAASAPAEAPRTWTPFMTRMVARAVRDAPTPIAFDVLALPDFPDAVRAALRTLACEDTDRTITRAVCRTVPRIMTVDDLDTQVLWRDGKLLPELVLNLFDVLPPALQTKYWRSAYQVHPARTVSDMADHAEVLWPGLTADDLQPLLTHAEAPVRLAAIQLLAQIAGAGDTPIPVTSPGVGLAHGPGRSVASPARSGLDVTGWSVDPSPQPVPRARAPMVSPSRH